MTRGCVSFVKSTLTSKQFARSCWYLINRYSTAEAHSPKQELDVESKQVDNIITDNTSLHPDHVTESTHVCCNDVMNTYTIACIYWVNWPRKPGPLMT